ncbi:unnamed protein product [Protopolystoma xenopodis]|uniref:Uncharacterized protein n=1 Tax=Protopolystoma xenopodis TaxID=117903 RepID=A0A448XKQ2_9PLAT|nr:unnamed protein product [Protopolystoma xenopodis]
MTVPEGGQAYAESFKSGRLYASTQPDEDCNSAGGPGRARLEGYTSPETGTPFSSGDKRFHMEWCEIYTDSHASALVVGQVRSEQINVPKTFIPLVMRSYSSTANLCPSNITDLEMSTAPRDSSIMASITPVPVGQSATDTFYSLDSTDCLKMAATPMWHESMFRLAERCVLL